MARNTAWTTLAQGVRLAIQGVYFVIIARGLGSNNYGAFVAVTALVAIVAPFSGLGFGNVLVKNVARNARLFDEYWGNALLVTVISGALLTTLLLFLGHFLLPTGFSFSMILLLAGSDLLCAKITELAGQAFQAFDQLHWTANLNVTLSALRCVGAIVLTYAWQHPGVLQWTCIYLITSLMTAAWGLFAVTRKLGRPQLALWRVRSEMREGIYFASGLSSMSIYNDIDKTMLARFSTLEAAGIYAAAYRLIDVAFTPIRALLVAAFPAFFRAGQEGVAGTVALTRRLLPRAAAYSFAVYVVLMLIAPLLPAMLGREYANAVGALRWLAFLPLIKTCHYLLADALTGAGYQRVRMLIQVAVAVFNVLLNLWIIPAYSWRGAAWSSLASDGLLMVAVVSALLILQRRQQSAAIEVSA